MTLPPGWAGATLGDICEPVSKWDPRTEPARQFDYIDIGGIEQQRIAATKKYSGAEAPSRARQIVKGGDTVLSTVRTYLKKTALVPSELDATTASTGFCVLRPSAVLESRFLYYRVTADDFVSALTTKQTGSSYPAVRDRDVLAQRIAVPPLAEQGRIVAAIEEQFSRLEAALTSVVRVAGRLQPLRASVIDAAFDRSWQMKPFESVAKVASDLVDPASHAAAPHIAPNHIEAGTGRLLPYRTIADDGVTSAKHRFRPGQVLYSKIRPYLKKAIVADFHGLCSADMYPIDTTLDPRFLKWWMLSERFTADAVMQQGRSVLPKINKEGLSRLLVPVPNPNQQRVIADSIEKELSLVESLRGSTESTQARSAALRRSILEQAFRGELVPQDPHDEPASVLLERIRAERAAPPGPGRRRRVSA